MRAVSRSSGCAWLSPGSWCPGDAHPAIDHVATGTWNQFVPSLSRSSPLGRARDLPLRFALRICSLSGSRGSYKSCPKSRSRRRRRRPMAMTDWTSRFRSSSRWSRNDICSPSSSSLSSIMVRLHAGQKKLAVRGPASARAATNLGLRPGFKSNARCELLRCLGDGRGAGSGAGEVSAAALPRARRNCSLTPGARGGDVARLLELDLLPTSV